MNITYFVLIDELCGKLVWWDGVVDEWEGREGASADDNN